MEFDIRDILAGMAVMTQIATAAVFVQSNRLHINKLQENNDEMKQWLKQLQEKVTELRIKVGI